MKLTEAVAFATSHEAFFKFLKSRSINENSASSLHARLAKLEKGKGAWIELIIDYGKPGKSGDDIRIIIYYDIKKGNFNFYSIHFAGSKD